MKRALAGAIAASLAVSAPAAPTPAELQSQLAGHWAGALGYSDYQSNKLCSVDFSEPNSAKETPLIRLGPADSRYLASYGAIGKFLLLERNK